jgi:photosystem II stability/assembly factor-like uncharacterized protein
MPSNKTTILIGISLSFFHHLGAQIKADQPFGKASDRLLWEQSRLADPGTGKIPANMRAMEVTYASTLPVETAMVRRNGTPVQFNSRGPWNVGGRTRAFGIDRANENRLISGSVSGGIWYSDNNGLRWKKASYPQQAINPTCLIQDTRGSKRNTWWLGTGEAYGASPGAPGAYYYGDGIFKSTDSGKTWNQILNTASAKNTSFQNNWQLVWNLAMDFSAPDSVDEIYVATYGTIFRTENGGKNWTAVRQGTSYFTDVAVSSTGVVYVTMSSDGSQKGIWRSTDGKSFTNITPANFPASYRRIVIGIDPNNENRVYFLANTPGFGKTTKNFQGDAEDNSFYRYRYVKGNGADTNGIWENLSMNLPASGGQFDKWNVQGSYDMVVSVKPGDSNTVIIGGTNLYRSVSAFSDSTNTKFIGGYEEGSALPQINSYINHHPDQHGIVFYPSNANKAISFHDGGLSFTGNISAGTVAWTSLNNGYLTSQFYTVAIDHATKNDPVIIGGTQDNGSWFSASTSAESPWVSPRGGDGSYCAIADGKSMYYLSIQNAKMMKAKLSAAGERQSFARIDPIGLKKPKFINPYVLDPNNNNAMYLAGGKYLWRNHDLAAIPLINNWDSISTNWTRWADSIPTANSFISAVHATKTPANIVYYGTDRQKLYKVENAHNGTPKPVEITSYATGSNFPASANISCVTSNPLDGNEVMVSFSNYNVYSIFISYDAGKTWAIAGGNLEPSDGTGPSVRWLSILPVTDGKIYFAATSAGLYATRKIDGRNTVWVRQGDNSIGMSVCDMIDTRLSDGLVAVGTHAMGVFTANYTSVENIVSTREIEQGDELRFAAIPNPASNLVQFSFLSAVPATGTIKIFDNVGRVLYSQPMNITAGINNLPVQLTEYREGIYYARLNAPGYEKTIRFAVAK